LLEFPRSGSDETLTLEDAKLRVTEQTATAFRVALALAPGETRTVTAWLDRPDRRDEALLDGDDDILQAVIGADKLNPAGRTALSHVLELRRDAARKEAEVARQRTLLSDVEQNEDRLRKNLAAVTTADPLRARLTKALDADETKIDQLRTAIDQAQTEADKSHRALADAVATLHI
jgi:Sec-independent protein translocase protein TatA